MIKLRGKRKRFLILRSVAELAQECDRLPKEVCETNSWTYKSEKNHSKVLLFDTDAGMFVIETSSNLNENPKIEQFSFEQDAQLFEFYLKEIFGHGS